MSTFLSTFTVLVILALIALIILAVFGFIEVPKNMLPDKRSREDGGKQKNNRNCRDSEVDLSTQTFSFAKLVQMEEDGSSTEFMLPSSIPDEGISIGRDTDNDICLTSEYVSGCHARLGKDEKGFFVIDMGSSNGTFDGEQNRKKQIDLSYGDMFYLADIGLCLQAVNPFSKKEAAKHQTETGQRFQRIY